MNTSANRLVVASNRLPVVVERDADGWAVAPAAGGLVTAMRPVLRARGGTWVGWSGIAGEDPGIDTALADFVAGEKYDFATVSMSAAEVKGFYRGFSNEVVWPLFHDLFCNCVFEPQYWRSYQTVNRRFAEVIAGHLEPGDTVWVHDYHLMDVAAELRAMGLRNRVGFFLHVPFPGPDIFLKLPWRNQIMEALLAFNELGFQSERDQRNFLACAHRVTGRGEEIPCDWGVRLRPGPDHVAAGKPGIAPGELVVSVCPISIDFDEFADRADAPEVEAIVEQLGAEFPDRRVILGVDRLDYSKGLPQKLAAFRTVLERHPDMRRHVTLVQHVVPSREEVPNYQRQRLEVERMVGEINGTFSEPGWVPVHYFYHTLSRDELIAWYRVADISLTTPLKDGMNLVAKEFCACHVDERGVLVLSEFAGAAAEMGEHALIVNPFDLDEVAQALRRACEMPDDEQRARMRALRELLRENDVHRWADRCLDTIAQRPWSGTAAAQPSVSSGRDAPVTAPDAPRWRAG